MAPTDPNNTRPASPEAMTDVPLSQPQPAQLHRQPPAHQPMGASATNAPRLLPRPPSLSDKFWPGCHNADMHWKMLLVPQKTARSICVAVKCAPAAFASAFPAHYPATSASSSSCGEPWETGAASDPTRKCSAAQLT